MRMTVKVPNPGRHFGCIEFVRGRGLSNNQSRFTRSKRRIFDGTQRIIISGA